MPENDRGKLIRWLVLLTFLYPSVTFGESRRSVKTPLSAVHHDIAAEIDPVEKRLSATDTITLQGGGDHKILFRLRRDLSVTSASAGVSLRMLEKSELDKSNRENSSSSAVSDSSVASYLMVLPPNEEDRVNVTLTFSGKITSEKSETSDNNPASHDPVSSKGIFMSGGDFWYPSFGRGLITFSLETTIPAPWVVVSQGERTLRSAKDGFTTTRWNSQKPTDEVLLIGGKFTEYSRSENGVTAMAFLRSPDNELAERYISTTFSYLEIFQQLNGPYPYKKFALVENFLPTGYGMPSLTLLGSNIIRFPFILHSSYPHELLHNWWGNSVFIDHDSGNWAEGLTVYLADHLVRERRGGGVEYRRTSLQKYTDYVNVENDFPLTSFRSRQDEASQAIGYGKTMMMFHMLRVTVGDKQFVESLKHFYKENIFRRASFDDIRRSFENVTGLDLTHFFSQWVTRKGAPSLELSKASSKKTDTGYLLSFTLKQRSEAGEGPYRLDIPIAVSLKGKSEVYSEVVKLNKKSMAYTLLFASRPLALSADPEFDVFRRLDRNEIPPSLSRAFGSKKATILLPSAASDELKNAYSDLARIFSNRGGGGVTIAFDREYKVLPGGTVWILGTQNTHSEEVKQALSGYDYDIQREGIRFGLETFALKNRSFAVATSRDDAPGDALVWISADTPGALPGLSRKLPHYGKYSFLLFKGEEPVNIHKGVWPVRNSPLSSRVKQHDGVTTDPFSSKLPARPAL